MSQLQEAHVIERHRTGVSMGSVILFADKKVGHITRVDRDALDTGDGYPGLLVHHAVVPGIANIIACCVRREELIAGGISTWRLL